MRKVSILMAFLVTGYVLGIWNFLVLPKYYINFGLKGFLLSLMPTLVALFLMYSEAESTKKTRYLIYELFFKVSRKPAIVFTLLMFLMILLGITTYYASYSLVFMAGVSSSYAYITGFILLTMLLALGLVLLAKARTLEFISVVSILFVIFTIVAAIMIRNQAISTVTSDQARIYMHEAVSAITSFGQPLMAKGIFYMLVSVFISFGLGTGVYYVIGSFSPENLDFKKVLAGVLILQVIISFAAAFTVAYSLGISHEAVHKAFQNPSISPEETMKLSIMFGNLKDYTTNSTQSPINAIGVFYSIPQILKGNVPNDTSIITLLMLSLYLAGFTTIIVLIEMGGQMLSEVMQLKRAQSLSIVSLVGMLISFTMMVKEIRIMFVVVPFAVGAFVAALEAYPTLQEALGTNRPVVGASIILLILVGIAIIYYSFVGSGIMVKLGAILGLSLFVTLTMNGMLLQSKG